MQLRKDSIGYENRTLILCTLSDMQWRSYGDLMRITGLNRPTVQFHIRDLIEKGQVEEHSASGGTRLTKVKWQYRLRRPLIPTSPFPQFGK